MSLRRRSHGDPTRTGDPRLDALIGLLAAPARPAELGDEPRIRALFLATRTTGTTQPPAGPAGGPSVLPALWPGLGAALNTVAVAAALAVRWC